MNLNFKHLKNSNIDVSKLKSWPFEEARRILAHIQGKVPEKGYVLLETGYGPSGLPHIGTFGEVARTIMVKNAFACISDIPTRLFAFSDDMDGLRKVPGNVPNQDMLRKHLGKPLSLVPDPYEKYESFGHHNNAMLRDFLDSFGFEYEFQSATYHYKAGTFDDMLLKVLAHYAEIMEIMLPTLREERRTTYSPFLPICKNTMQVLNVPMEKIYPEAGTIVYKDPITNKFIETLVTGGNCKLQWKADWGGRWYAFGVDYEMSGKDLIPSVVLAKKICKVLGGEPPETLSYELFLDQQGEKISKSRGNGLTIDEWLKYAPQESLAYYMFQTPRRAKRLCFEVIPKAMDDYLAMLEAFYNQDELGKLDNPVFHIHAGSPPEVKDVLSFNVLLNLASVCGAETTDVMWGFVNKYNKNVSPEKSPILDRLIKHALHYYQDFVKPNLSYKQASLKEKEALIDLEISLAELEKQEKFALADTIQAVVFEVGKKYYKDNLKEWFKTLYEILFGNIEGPRMGSFIALYGVNNTRNLIKSKL